MSFAPIQRFHGIRGLIKFGGRTTCGACDSALNRSSIFHNKCLVESCKLIIRTVVSGSRRNMTLNSASCKPFTVFVEGNVGSGKTTFLNHFASLTNVATLTEPVELWRNVRGENFLDLMYSNPSRWGITFQTYVQLTMLDLHTKRVDRPIKMMERSLFSARYCFVENLYQSGLMPKQDFIALDEWFNWIVKNLDVSGNLIIYLRTTPEVVHKRMMARARTEESCVPLQYLQQLHELHENWLINQSPSACSAPVLVVDANQDLDMMTKEFSKCQAEIADALKHIQNRRDVNSSPQKTSLHSPIKVSSKT